MRLAPWAFASICLVSHAIASTSPLTLTWSAPAECPTEADVIAQVDKHLGGSTSGSPLVASAKVTKREATWQVVLSTNQGGVIGERTLEGSTCVAVASATSLIIALTIDPHALSHHETTPPPPPPTASPPPPPPPKIERVPLPVSPMRPLFVRASPVVGFATVANTASVGAALAFGVVTRRLSIELAANVFFPESRDVDGQPGKGGSFWLVAVGGSACGAAISSENIRSGACAGFEVEAIRGGGYGVLQPTSGVAAWGAPTASVFFDVRITSAIWLATRVDGAIPLSHPTFVLDGVGPVFQVRPVSARASIGVELRF